MSKRTLVLAAVILVAAVSLLALALVRTRRRLNEAERYAESGLASWELVCISVSGALKHDIDVGANLVNGCLASEHEEARDMLDQHEFKRVAELILAGVAAHRLPHVVEPNDADTAPIPAGYQR